MILNFLNLLALIIQELGLGEKENSESTKVKKFNLNIILTCNISTHAANTGHSFRSYSNSLWEEQKYYVILFLLLLWIIASIIIMIIKPWFVQKIPIKYLQYLSPHI